MIIRVANRFDLAYLLRLLQFGQLLMSFIVIDIMIYQRFVNLSHFKHTVVILYDEQQEMEERKQQRQ